MYCSVEAVKCSVSAIATRCCTKHEWWNSDDNPSFIRLKFQNTISLSCPFATLHGNTGGRRPAKYGNARYLQNITIDLLDHHPVMIWVKAAKYGKTLVNDKSSDSHRKLSRCDPKQGHQTSLSLPQLDLLCCAPPPFNRTSIDANVCIFGRPSPLTGRCRLIGPRDRDIT